MGDEIVAAYGNRYAPNQFEAVVPQTLGPCHLVAAGGVAGKALTWHASVSKGATQIAPIGLLAGRDGAPVNLRDHALPMVDRVPGPAPTTVAVVGTAMDAGKTQTAAYLVRGLKQAGLRVGYAKITGTGSGNDTWLLRDAGADPVLDFTDAGLVSTYLATSAEVECVFTTLMAHLTMSKVSAVVLEIADGLLQTETAALLESPIFKELVSGLIFASCDSMGAASGHRWLTARQLPLIGLSGVLTAAPLQISEARTITGLPAFSRQDLGKPGTAIEILRMAAAASAAGAAPDPAPVDVEPSHHAPVAANGHVALTAAT